MGIKIKKPRAKRSRVSKKEPGRHFNATKGRKNASSYAED